MKKASARPADVDSKVIRPGPSFTLAQQFRMTIVIAQGVMI